MNRLTRTLALVSALAPFVTSLVAHSAQARSNAPYATVPEPAVSSGDTYKVRLVPSLVNQTPFPIEPPASEAGKGIVFRPQSRMTEADSGLASSAQPSIRGDAALQGFEFDQGKWTYQQLVCPALPGHLFLLYKGDNGTGDVSLFSAAIPRAGNGHALVIPIERRGFSLYSPAPVNALNIATFNRIRAGELASQSADWLTTALCYAALTGARPQISAVQKISSDANLALSFPPTLEVGANGESTVRFVDSAVATKPTEWALAFSSKGELVKVTISAVPLYAVRPIPTLPVQQSSQNGPH